MLCSTFIVVHILSSSPCLPSSALTQYSWCQLFLILATALQRLGSGLGEDAAVVGFGARNPLPALAAVVKRVVNSLSRFDFLLVRISVAPVLPGRPAHVFIGTLQILNRVLIIFRYP
jgi:hypothetical protein